MKKENLSRIIVAGLIATSISVYTNVDNTTFASHGFDWGQQTVSKDYVDGQIGKVEQKIEQQGQISQKVDSIQNGKIMQNKIHNIIQEHEIQ